MSGLRVDAVRVADKVPFSMKLDIENLKVGLVACDALRARGALGHNRCFDCVTDVGGRGQGSARRLGGMVDRVVLGTAPTRAA